MTPRICECCGQVIPPENPFEGRPVKARIYAFVSRHPEGVSREQIMDNVYADDRNGGPEWLTTISVHIHWINRKLAKLGLRISSPRGRRGCYKLHSLDELRRDEVANLAEEIRAVYPELRSYRRTAQRCKTSVGTVQRVLSGKSA